MIGSLSPHALLWVSDWLADDIALGNANAAGSTIADMVSPFSRVVAEEPL